MSRYDIRLKVIAQFVQRVVTSHNPAVNAERSAIARQDGRLVEALPVCCRQHFRRKRKLRGGGVRVERLCRRVVIANSAGVVQRRERFLRVERASTTSHGRYIGTGRLPTSSWPRVVGLVT